MGKSVLNNTSALLTAGASFVGPSEEEFDLIWREGVSYDSDSSGDFTDSEERSFHHNRLVR